MTERCNNLFLIGSGFTAAAFPDKAPLNRGLLQALIDAKPDSPLQLYRQVYGTSDIEVLLTRLDLETASFRSDARVAARHRLEADREMIDNQIAEYFEQFRIGRSQDALGNPWLEMFAKTALGQDDVIVTLNYDCFLEGLLDKHAVWSPSKGYGPVRTPVPGSTVALSMNPKNITIYKIHGSENFHRCPGERDASQEVKAIVSVDLFPRSGVNSRLGVADGRPRIIAPSFMKQLPEQMQQMMMTALDAAQSAANLIVIGCALRPEDSHLWLLLTRFIYGQREGRRIIIVDRDPEAVRMRILDQYQLGPNIPVDVLGERHGLDECAVRALICKLHREGQSPH